MKKKIILTAIMVSGMMLGTAINNKAQAQVFLMDEEEASNSGRLGGNGAEMPGLPGIPILNITNDQYAPVGEGLLVLGLLGGAYLFGKKRKEKE